MQPSIVYILLSAGYVGAGIIILIKDQFPLRGDRLVIGRPAQNIGKAWLIVGILGFFAEMLQVGQTSNYIQLLVRIIALCVMIYTYLTYKKRAQEIKPLKSHSTVDVFTVREAADYLKVEDVYVLHLIEDGDLKAKAIGGDYRISRESLETYLRS